MELKRYVLLNNNMIYDLVVERDVEKFNMVKNGNQRAYGIKKTSDNILDLVEVGDFVNGSQRIYASEVKKIDDKEIYTSIWCYWKYEITTIWKKQPNGDYKRYEVMA